MRIIALLLVLMPLSCGYHIAGYSDGFKYTYYIEDISNTTSDMTITTDIKRDVTRFFSDYGSLKSYDEAVYVLRINFSNLSSSAPILTKTGETLISNLSLTYAVTAEDKKGRVLYSRSITRSQNFTTGNDVTTFNKNRREAIEELTETILTEFKYDFEASR